MIQLNNAGYLPAPEATLTVNRNRLKSYGSTFYLKDGSNFEVELYNPLTSRVLVSIEMDGKLISSTGIVLNPGERSYLERWIDEPRKFKFKTYKVDDSPEAKAAIQNNGKIKVSFYEESNKFFYPTWGNAGVIYTSNGSQPFYYNGYGVTNTVNCSSIPGTVYYSSGLTTGISSFTNTGASTVTQDSSLIETGRAEKGENSSQNFNTTTGDFNSFPVKVLELSILPESLKPVEIVKIRSYCTECGTRVRASAWKFCPSCGEKL